MNIYEDYDDNTLSNHRPKAFLTFSEVDNEFLAANNFVALNLENLEESFIQASNNTAEINIDLGNYDLLENVIAERQNTPNSDAQETISKSNQYDDTFPLLPPATPIKRKKSKKVFTNNNTIPKTFPCDLCDEMFNVLSELKQHKSSVHVLSALYKCEQCSKSFNFEKNFMLHLASHTASAPARCPICAVTFQRISSFKGHLETHMDSDKFKCHRCDLEFEYEEYYERHLEKAHKRGGSGNMSSQAFVKKRNKDTLSSRKTGKYICKICGKRFAKPSLLLRHETAHTKVKPFECLECNQRFSQKSSLNRHSLVHNGTKPFDCPDCNLSFRQRTNLMVHINRVHSLDANAEDKFPCTKCSCVFNKLKSLNRHITLVHSRGGGQGGDCAEPENVDDDLFYINDVLNQIKCLQSDYIPPSSAPPHHITTEDNSFATNTINLPSLDQPQTINSNVEDIPQMQYVNLVDNLYPSNERVNRLVKEVYIDGTKWLECLYCPKKFLKPFDIVRHIRVHTKEKPYQCQICGRTFALKNTLTNHIRIHKRQLPEITKIYQCTVCLKRFDSLRRLDFHARQHRNYKPYACSICFKPFGSSNCLRIHQQIHKPKNPEEEEIKRHLLPPIVACLDDKISSTKDYPSSHRYQCAICGLKFQKSSHLKQHEDSHLGLKPFECLTCLRFFSTKSSLVHHQKIHLGHKTKECEQCYAKFFTSGDLKRHKLIHSTARNFMCPYCKKTFKLRTTCKSHISTHIKDVISDASPDRTENPENNSDICNYVLAGDDHNSADTIDSVNLNLPMQESDELLYADLGRLLPQNCTITTTDESTQNLPQMTAYNTTSKKRDHKTIRSSSKFINIRDLSNTENRLSKNIVVVSHEKILEDSVSPPNSPIKNVQTQQQEEFLFQEARSKMAEKERKHVSKKKLPYVCEICKKIFKKPIDLKRHMRTHTKEKPFQCEICGKAFSLKCTMEDHRITHQKDRPTFDCQVCGKKYATKNVLNIHLRIHTGERPYSCEICSRTFRTPGHRTVHLRIHSKEKLEVAKKKKK